MMPVMPMDPASRVAAVAQAMIESAASQSMEPGPDADPAAGVSGNANVGAASGGSVTGAADVMPVPPSTSMAAGTSVSLAPSEMRSAVSGAAVTNAGDPVAQTSGDTSASANSSGSRERVADKGADLNIPVVLSNLHVSTLLGPQRRRVEREAQQGRQRRKPTHEPPDDQGFADPEHDDKPGATSATPRRPLTMAVLRQTVLRHAGGLAWTEWHEGRRVIVLDTARAQEGQLRGALLSRDAQGQKTAMMFRAETTPGWGWAWARLSGRHWRLCRDLEPAGLPVLISPEDTDNRPFCICLHQSDASPQHDASYTDKLLRIKLADPLLFQRRLGRQWTYLALLQSLDHEHDEHPAS